MTELPTRNRIVIVVGPQLWHKNTCATLIRAGLDIVGICYCDQRTFHLPLRTVWRSLKKDSVWKTMGRIAGRVYYNLLNGKKDRFIAERLFDQGEIEQVLSSWRGPVHTTDDYSRPDTIDWLDAMKADFFVVHTPAWVGKKVRQLPAKGILGGHPGLTPAYRGSHSTFWAIYHSQPENVGASVFWLDAGVDTGDLIVQEHIPIEHGDSFITLGWKGMIRIAELQAQVLDAFDHGIDIPRHSHREIPPNSLYPVPTLCDYLRYRHRQKDVR